MNPYSSGSSSGINPNSGSLSGWSQVPATSDVDVNFNEIQNVQNIYFTDGTNYSDATTTNQGIIASLSSDIGLLFNPPMATYYKSSQQLASSGATAIEFDSQMSWSNNDLISQDTSSTFLVNQSGIYQLELNYVALPNGQTWTNFRKACQFSLTRNGATRQIMSQFGYANSPENFSQGICGTYELLENDIIAPYFISSHTGQILIDCINNVDPHDLNTFFTWRVVSKSFTP